MKNGFETQILCILLLKEDAHHSLSMPVYHTAAYEFETAEEMEAAFWRGQTAGHAYSQLQTYYNFEDTSKQRCDRCAERDGVNSGIAAISNAHNHFVKCRGCLWHIYSAAYSF